MSQTTERNEKVVREIYEECLNRGRAELLPELVADEYVGIDGERGPSGFGATLTDLQNAFPDIHYTIEDVIAEDDRVVVRWTWEETHRGSFRGLPPSNARVTDTANVIYEFEKGKIVRAWIQSDRLGFFQQIGVAPPLTQSVADSRS